MHVGDCQDMKDCRFYFRTWNAALWANLQAKENIALQYLILVYVDHVIKNYRLLNILFVKDSRKETLKQKKEFKSLMQGVVIVLSGFQNPLRGELRDKALMMGAKYKADWGEGCTHLVFVLTFFTHVFILY